MLKGVEVVEVNPAYTSVIGMLKYAPPLNISPLKPVLVEGAWDRVRSRLVPLEAEGTVPMRDF
jgi:hypothetical protein